MGQQKAIRGTFMRTGTSKSVYFKRNELPEDRQERDKIILSVMGSPDPRQINGMGGGEVSTSKVALISVSQRPDADIDYTFCQVAVEKGFVDYAGNCGNCSSGVGPFAIDEGMVPVTEPITRVRIYNTNTDKVIIADVPVAEGKAAVNGDYRIDGVPGTGARIDLDFRNTVGSARGVLFPTGNRQDTVVVPELGEIPVTIADLGNVVVFFHAKYVGATGLENRLEINGNKTLMQHIEAIREQCAILLGFCQPGESAKTVTPSRPMVVFFAEPQDFTDYVTGTVFSGETVDFVARNVFLQSAIDTFTATGGICTALVSIIPGTTLYQAATRRNPGTDEVFFGNPRGITDISVRMTDNGEEVVVERAVLARTARRLMDGYVYIPE